jgi:hypothetical protein
MSASSRHNYFSDSLQHSSFSNPRLENGASLLRSENTRISILMAILLLIGSGALPAERKILCLCWPNSILQSHHNFGPYFPLPFAGLQNQSGSLRFQPIFG